MACGLPAIAVDRFGPADIVEHGRTGWLVEPDDVSALADAMVAAVRDGRERRRRGEAALTTARERWSWPVLAGRVAHVLDEVAALEGARHAAPQTG